MEEKDETYKLLEYKLGRLVDAGIMEAEDVAAYMAAVAKGEKLYSNRSVWFNTDRANYAYDMNFVEDLHMGIEDKLRTDLTQHMEITKETLYDGFAPQIYEAAMNEKVIAFPSGINYGDPKVMNDIITSQSYVRKEDEPEAMQIMVDRWKYAMIAWDTNRLIKLFDPESKTSIHKTVEKPSGFATFTSFLMDRVSGEKVYDNLKKDYKRHEEGQWVRYRKNYARELNKAILYDTPHDANVEYITTYNGVIAISKDPNVRAKQMKAFGVSPQSKNSIEELKAAHDKMVESGKSRWTIMGDIEQATGLKNHNTGFKIYDYDTFDKSREFLIKTFNQYPSTSKRAYGVPEIDMRNRGGEGL